MVEPEVDMVLNTEQQKVTNSSSTSSGSDGNGASSPNTVPSPPQPAKYTGPTLDVDPSLRAKRALRRRGAIAKHDPDVTQVTTQLPLPPFQHIEEHQAEVPPAHMEITIEAVVADVPPAEVAKLPIEEPKDSQPVIAATAYEPSEPAEEEQAPSSAPEVTPEHDDVGVMAEDEAINANPKVTEGEQGPSSSSALRGF
jgi:hypothetical protein